MKRVDLKKLDRRFAGGANFGYCLEFVHPHKDGHDFCTIREWCWQVFGPGRELKFLNPKQKYTWAFLTDNHRTRIYLYSDAELNWYKLKFQ